MIHLFLCLGLLPFLGFSQPNVQLQFKYFEIPKPLSAATFAPSLVASGDNVFFTVASTNSFTVYAYICNSTLETDCAQSLSFTITETNAIQGHDIYASGDNLIAAYSYPNAEAAAVSQLRVFRLKDQSYQSTGGNVDLNCQDCSFFVAIEGDLMVILKSSQTTVEFSTWMFQLDGSWNMTWSNTSSTTTSSCGATLSGSTSVFRCAGSVWVLENITSPSQYSITYYGLDQSYIKSSFSSATGSLYFLNSSDVYVSNKAAPNVVTTQFKPHSSYNSSFLTSPLSLADKSYTWIDSIYNNGVDYLVVSNTFGSVPNFNANNMAAVGTGLVFIYQVNSLTNINLIGIFAPTFTTSTRNFGQIVAVSSTLVAISSDSSIFVFYLACANYTTPCVDPTSRLLFTSGCGSQSPYTNCCVNRTYSLAPFQSCQNPVSSFSSCPSDFFRCEYLQPQISTVVTTSPTSSPTSTDTTSSPNSQSSSTDSPTTTSSPSATLTSTPDPTSPSSAHLLHASFGFVLSLLALLNLY